MQLEAQKVVTQQLAAGPCTINSLAALLGEDPTFEHVSGAKAYRRQDQGTVATFYQVLDHLKTQGLADLLAFNVSHIKVDDRKALDIEVTDLTKKGTALTLRLHPYSREGVRVYEAEIRMSTCVEDATFIYVIQGRFEKADSRLLRRLYDFF